MTTSNESPYWTPVDLLRKIHQLSETSAFPWFEGTCSMCNAQDRNMRDHDPNCVWYQIEDLVG